MSKIIRLPTKLKIVKETNLSKKVERLYAIDFIGSALDKAISRIKDCPVKIAEIEGVLEALEFQKEYFIKIRDEES